MLLSQNTAYSEVIETRTRNLLETVSNATSEQDALLKTDQVPGFSKNEPATIKNYKLLKTIAKGNLTK